MGLDDPLFSFLMEHNRLLNEWATRNIYFYGKMSVTIGTGTLTQIWTWDTGDDDLDLGICSVQGFGFSSMDIWNF